MADYEAKEFFFDPNDIDESIGAAIKDSLAQSRFLTLEEVQSRRERAVGLYDAWVQKIMELYSYKTKRAMFKDMKRCSIYLIEGQIEICPTRHDKLEGWEELDKTKSVLVHADATSSEIGAALRLAFSRCI